MKLEKVKLSDLKRPEKNVRIHPKKQIEEMVRSVEMFGQIRPLIVDENNVILAGNGLFEALMDMGRTEAEVYRVQGLSEAKKKKLMLADNKVYSLGMDDNDTVMDILAELKDELNVPGFDDELLEDLLADMDETEEEIADYGKLDEEEVTQFHQAEERKEAAMERAERVIAPEPTENASQPSPAPAEDESDPDPSPTDVERAVTCPHCGGRIRL